MSERVQVERHIRDWLTEHLEFIDSELTLIAKEYPLHDPVGAAGFIDILCKDVFGNFVIVEIKRSENAARQTISEILKYHSLIRHNFRARDSEIRIVIVSTVWNELIRPFSELFHRTSLDVRGYQISIDENFVPLSVETVQPLDPVFLSRKFAYWYGLFLFEEVEERDVFYRDFVNYLKQSELEDFVFLKLCTDPLGGKIMFPHAALVAFQQLTIDELLGVIKRLDQQVYEELFPISEFEDPQEYQGYLESQMINALESLGQLQESEPCYSFKVYTMLNAENWTIEHIEKSGVFSSDPRYTKEILVEELTGTDGRNEYIFYGWTESTQRERFNEIVISCRNALAHSPVWLETIAAIMDKLRTETRKFRLMINIHNRKALIPAIYHAMKNRELGYMPQYFISVDYLEEELTELYYGSLLWNNDWPDSPWVKPMTIEQRGEKMFELMVGPNNQRDAFELGLGYATTKYNLIGDESKFEGFLQGVAGKLERQDYYILNFMMYAVIHEDNLNRLIENFESNYVNDDPMP